MAYVGRRAAACAAGAIAAIVQACGSDTPAPSRQPEAGTIIDATPDTRPPPMSTGGASGMGGAAGMAGMLGTGCTLADAEAPPETVQFDASVPGTADASVLDGAKSDARSPKDAGRDAHEAGTGPVTYPPLRFSAIGKVVPIRTDFLFTEGPIWDPSQQALFFTDINADAIYRLTLPDAFDIIVPHAGYPDGLALDQEGNLIAAGYVSRDVWRLDGGKPHTIADSYRGRKLNSPDEVVVRSDGVIYFTDPIFGIDGSQGFTAQTAELCFQGVYRVTTDGVVHLEDQTTAGPNGVVFSPDEQILYVSYTNTGEIYTFDVSAGDGALRNKTLFASGVLVADSTCVDAGGNLYVASLAGVTVLDPAGKQLGVIATPGQYPTNCAFGGPDQRTLFITARTLLVGTPTAGNSSLLRVDDMPIPGIPGRP